MNALTLLHPGHGLDAVPYHHGEDATFVIVLGLIAILLIMATSVKR